MIIIAVRAVSGTPALFEPFMFVAGMVNHQVHHKFDSPAMHAADQVVEIIHGPEILHDIAVIADIVAIVVVGGRIDRIQPDYIDAQAPDIIEPGDDTSQVPDAVPVCILKTPWIDLVYDGFLPPLAAGNF
jgi:hypothetical protein